MAINPVNKPNNESFFTSIISTLATWEGRVLSWLSSIPSALAQVINKIAAIGSCQLSKEAHPSISALQPKSFKASSSGKMQSCLKLLNEMTCKEDLDSKGREIEKIIGDLEQANAKESGLDSLKSNYTFLKAALQMENIPFFYGYKRVDEKGIIEVPGDGNCLYHSVSLLLELETKTIEAPVCTHAELREMAASYLEKNKESDMISMLIQVDIGVFNEDLERGCKQKIASLKELELGGESYEEEIKNAKEEYEQNKIKSPEEFIEKSRELGFWGCNSHVYALSCLLKKPITITYQYDTPNQYAATINPSNSDKSPLEIVHVNGNHFNSKVT